ncbi:hypothetical protein Cpir12675_006514 [Ceratocystis pirilliformis]|uniref:SMODS and SLOG-associating 2TM effector domain-containing protein n=1 Tax=Ceratocystis pirilliformis TaxID=259994 RepID=A0ABR3YI20_9PEZI
MTPSKSRECSCASTPSSSTPLLAPPDSSKRATNCRCPSPNQTADGKRQDCAALKPSSNVVFPQASLQSETYKTTTEVSSSKSLREPTDSGDESHRLLSDCEWRVIAESVGALTNGEDAKLVHANQSLWPPRGMPLGLYRDIVFLRAKYFYLYHAIITIQWAGMVLQLFLGASLTAIGSMSIDDSTTITCLAGANTVIAGILALIHNSGLPNRYHNDRAEFVRVEDHIRKILEGGVVEQNMTTQDIIANCFEMYKKAKEAVFVDSPGYSGSPFGHPTNNTPRYMTFVPRAMAPLTTLPKPIEIQTEVLSHHHNKSPTRLLNTKGTRTIGPSPDAGPTPTQHAREDKRVREAALLI